MKKSALFALVVMAGMAQADVKPVDYIGTEVCGQPNRTERVCLHKATRTGRNYLTIERQKQTIWIPVQLQPTGVAQPVIGSMNETYVGIGISNDGGHTVEATYSLETSRPVVPNAKTTGKLLTNGKAAATGHGGFTLETVFTTADEK